MNRWGRFIGVFACALLVAPPCAHARATSAYAKAVLTTCDTVARVAVFEGRLTPIRRAAKAQLRFTLQAMTPDDLVWRRVRADGFGAWITAPAGVGRYLYDKRVEKLLAPGSYRVAIDFRWRDAHGRQVRSEKLLSPVCRLPDPRPDLQVRDLRVVPTFDADPEQRRYVALVANRGRSAAGAFEVDFFRAGVLLGTVPVAGADVGEVVTVALAAPACMPGEQISVVVDARSAVDEADESDDTASVTC